MNERLFSAHVWHLTELQLLALAGISRVGREIWGFQALYQFKSYLNIVFGGTQGKQQQHRQTDLKLSEQRC